MHTTVLFFSILLYFVLHEIVRGCIGRISSSHVPLKEVRNIFALSWNPEKGHLAWVQISYGEKFFLYTFHSGSRFYFYFLFGYHNVHTEYTIYEGMKKDAVRDLYYHQLMFNLIRKMYFCWKICLFIPTSDFLHDKPITKLSNCIYISSYE